MLSKFITEARHEHAVVVAVDRNYLPLALFVLNQLAADAERSGYDLVLLRAFRDDFTVPATLEGRLRIIDFDEDSLPDLPTPLARISKATYLRLYIPKLFAQIYTKIIYLDVDIYVRHANLAPLFRLDMGNFPVAAVRGVQSFARPDKLHRDYFEGLGLAWGTPYFNAGVMVVAPALAERLKVFDDALQFALEFPEKCQCGDQSALNHVLKNQWMEISPRWNWLNNWTIFFALQKRMIYRHNPSILHFNGRRKYWKDPRGFYETPYASDARTFLSGTEWERFVPHPRRTIRSSLALAIRRVEEEWRLLAAYVADRLGTSLRYRRFDFYSRYLDETRFADVEQNLCPPMGAGRL